MTQITLAQYFMGRDKQYAAELTDAMREAAEKLLIKVNTFLEEAVADGVELSLDVQTLSPVASGWRPPSVNKAAGGAPSSNHLKCHAIDLRDNAPGRALCRYAVSRKGQELLVRLGLYCEAPRFTKTWLHLQDVAPNSGKRFFIPSAGAKPSAAPLPGELT